MEQENKGGIKDRLTALEDESQKKKQKKFRMPVKGKVSKSKMKRGYASVCILHENRGVKFSKEPIIGGTIRLGSTVHVVESLDVFNYKNKPFLIIPKTKDHAYNPDKPTVDPTTGKNETHGHKYIMSRMESEGLKLAKRAMGGMVIFGLIVVGIIAYYLFAGGSG